MMHSNMTDKSHSHHPVPGEHLDHLAHAQIAPLTGGVSPAAMRLAFDDWLTHLSHSPAEQMELGRKFVRALSDLSSYAVRASSMPGGACEPCVPPAKGDPRFASEAWKAWPFNILSQSFLVAQQWWQDATTNVRGVSGHHEDVVSYSAKQMLDTLSPANFLWTNPEVLERTWRTGGTNLMQGFQNFQEDAQRSIRQAPPAGVEAYKVGENVAITPGQVIYRNRLIELIQYAPDPAQGGKAHPEPILVVPAWIMKYYILDLSPDNSLIRHLVSQGFTVFAISWLNPGEEERDLGMDDYRELGVMSALDVIGKVCPGQKIHAAGYCLGGTLLSIAAAAMGREGDERLASMTLFAAQTDFTEPGELDLFIDESQVSYLEDIMWEKGYLDNSRMAGAFQMINSASLVWSRILKDYLMGERTPVSDLMAWNADGTRMPYRMHSEYLRRLFLNNDLASGRYPVGNKPVALTDIRCPIFCVGTLRDHVAPWRSVYKLHLLADTELTFLLTSGGHNVGIVNPPGVPGRSYQVLTRPVNGNYLSPDDWLTQAPRHEGSWWPEWVGWLKARVSAPVKAPAMGAPAQGIAPLCPAPGTYVLQT